MNIKIGDYFVLGKYLGQPILWRCIAFHKIDPNNQLFLKGYQNGLRYGLCLEESEYYKRSFAPLLLSDRILCFKVFDAPGNISNGSHAVGKYRKRIGSPFWGDSNIRCWLNSDKDAGGVEWICGNPPTKESVSSWNEPYDGEAGFLHGFTSEEIGLIRTVSQDTELHPIEHEDMDSYYREIVCEPQDPDNQDFLARKEYEESIISHFFKYEDLFHRNDKVKVKLYAERFDDKVFLLDRVQYHSLIANEGLLGSEYCRAKMVVNISKPDTIANCYSKVISDLYDYGFHCWWLRAPSVDNDTNEYDFTDDDTKVLVINSNGDCIDVGPSANATGIRPAFYLNHYDESILQGDGTIEQPFRLK